MDISRTFLGWDGPVLHKVVKWLSQAYERDSKLDLSNIWIVVPGGQAGRRLLELLVAEAEQRKLLFLPPGIRTVGDLPELLYQPKRPFADRLTQHLAWLHTVCHCDRATLRRFVKQVPDNQDNESVPAQTDLANWLQLAQLLWEQHRELAGEHLGFEDVVNYGQRTPFFQDTERWKFLRQLQLEYLSQLERCQLWDRQTARRFAIEHEECRTDKDIILVAMANMNRATRCMLDKVADRVTALIAAPSELTSHFDDHGCLNLVAWNALPIDLEERQIRSTDNVQGQATAVAEILGSYNGRYRADEITIGLPDESVAPWIGNHLEEHGVSTYAVGSCPIRQTAVCQLIAAIADFLEDGSYDAFASLVRHPEVSCWLDKLWNPNRNNSLHLLSQLDQFQHEVLPAELLPSQISSKRFPIVRKTLLALEQLLLPLKSPESKTTGLPLNEWPKHIVNLLKTFYGETVVERHDPSKQGDLAAISRIKDGLTSLQNIPVSLTLTVTASQTLRWLLQLMEADIAHVVKNAADVAMLGWLELPLDPSPALIVTSFNEEYIPDSLVSDLFLPNRLRRELGLVDNTHRYARDAYALSLLTHTRQDLTLIVPQRDTAGNPLTPTRLLFATDVETMAQRALRLFRPHEEAATSPLTSTNSDAGDVTPGFNISPAQPLDKPIDTMSVTSFRSYLACPYRFYLCHVLKLRSVDDRLRELDAPQFGDVIHTVLSHFGQSDVRNSDREPEIREWLDAELQNYTCQCFGTTRLPAVNLQITQARARLHAFATWQASWVQQGWRIHDTEIPSDDQTIPWNTREGTIHIRGRIDRMDRHESNRQWAIFDYKTSDTAKGPEKTHRTAGKWKDLQLPLYRHIVQKLLNIPDPLTLGYILLPKDPHQVGEYMAKWNEEHLKSADNTIDDVVRAVLAERFWPPTLPAPKILQELAPLCHEGVLAS